MDSQFLQRSSNKFKGGAFHHSLPKGKVDGVLVIHGDTLEFESEFENVQFAIKSLRVTYGGPGNRWVMFKNQDLPDWTLFANDHNILGIRALCIPEIREQFAKSRRWKFQLYSLCFVLVVFISLIIYGLFSLKQPFVNYAVSKIPLVWEEKIGEVFFENLSQSNRIVSKSQVLRILTPITERLIQSVSGEHYEFRFHIAIDPTVNAFAIPGGDIVIHSGLLSAASSPEEIAGVLAHEIAHVTLRHGMRKLVSSAGIYFLIQTIVGDVSWLISLATESSSFLLVQKYSRDFEREADSVGWQYLVQANINPKGMIDFFSKLNQEQAKILKEDPLAQVRDFFPFLSTHPTTDNRMKKLNEKYSEIHDLGTFQPIQLDLGNLKDKVEELAQMKSGKRK